MKILTAGYLAHRAELVRGLVLGVTRSHSSASKYGPSGEVEAEPATEKSSLVECFPLQFCVGSRNNTARRNTTNIADDISVHHTPGFSERVEVSPEMGTALKTKKMNSPE